MMSDEKLRRRSELLPLRGKYQADWLDAHSRLLSLQIINWPVFAKADSIMGYLAFGKEAVIDEVLLAGIHAGKKIFVPYIPPDGHKVMQAVRLKDFSQLSPDYYGIRTCKGSSEFAAPEQLELILAPGLAFTKAGIRLGLGGGFYDRFLAAATGAVKAGITLTPQLAEELPYDEHDIKMDFIITETGVIQCRTTKEAVDLAF